MSRDILVNLIDPDPDQPRKHFDEAGIQELAQSIKANGLAVPILLRPNGERFFIVHGERRWRAAQLLGWESIPAEVRDISQDEGRWLALVENVQRADLSPIEEAQAYQARLSEGLTQEQLGQRIGKTQSYIATKLRLLKLPDEIQQTIEAGQITEGHGKQLLRLAEYPLVQRGLGWQVNYYSVSVHSLQAMVTRILDHIEMVNLIKQDNWAEANKILIKHLPFDPPNLEDDRRLHIRYFWSVAELYVHLLIAENRSKIKEDVSLMVWLLVATLVHQPPTDRDYIKYGLSLMLAVEFWEDGFDVLFIWNGLNTWRRDEGVKPRAYPGDL